jgi:hypothetical protein
MCDEPRNVSTSKTSASKTWNARAAQMAEAAPSVHRRRLREKSWEMLADLEKRHPTAENDNVIEFVLPPNDPKRKQ